MSKREKIVEHFNVKWRCLTNGEGCDNEFSLQAHNLVSCSVVFARQHMKFPSSCVVLFAVFSFWRTLSVVNRKIRIKRSLVFGRLVFDFSSTKMKSWRKWNLTKRHNEPITLFSSSVLRPKSFSNNSIIILFFPIRSSPFRSWRKSLSRTDVQWHLIFQ